MSKIKPTMPTIVCLCGSTRFMDAFFEAGWRETLDGRIVLSVGVCKHVGSEGHGGEALGPEVAAKLDNLHLRKIDLADEILVLNVDGYVGESTWREIEYARKHQKPIRWLNPNYIDGWQKMTVIRQKLLVTIGQRLSYCRPRMYFLFSPHGANTDYVATLSTDRTRLGIRPTTLAGSITPVNAATIPISILRRFVRKMKVVER